MPEEDEERGDGYITMEGGGELWVNWDRGEAERVGGLRKEGNDGEGALRRGIVLRASRQGKRREGGGRGI
jgi:hypothetical protein